MIYVQPSLTLSHRHALLRYAILIAGLSALTLGCTTPVPPNSCITVEDCEGELACIQGRCQPLSSPSMPDVECFQNADCGDAARCVEGMCFQNECTDGEIRPCETACGTGDELCSGGIWRSCNRQPGVEICGTGEDEDCDGTSDEECGGCEDGRERDCATACGMGRERCIGGQFTGCTAPRVRPEVCGDPNNPEDEDCDMIADEGCADCEDGATRSCRTECSDLSGVLGEEVCQDRTWQNCTAQVPIDELCDGVDNDCDGMTDEDIVRNCSNACGMGSERCEGGSWVGCDAPENCNCTVEQGVDARVCNSCGEQTRMCEGPQWGEWSMCIEAGQCSPGEVREADCGLCGRKRQVCLSDCTLGEWQACLGEGVCSPGEVQSEACPSGCGERTRQCTDQCAWGEWSSCEGMGIECSPGQMESEACGECGGMKVRSCSDACTWMAWGTCDLPPDSCIPGETEDMVCGACQTQSRSCLDDCTWGEWGACLAGTCTPSDVETRPCGFCGTQTRTCTTECGWSDWSDCGGQGVCAPGEEITDQCGVTDVGVCEFGTAESVCNSECQWDVGECVGEIAPEPNDFCGSSLDLDCDGQLTRRPDDYEGSNGNDSCFSCSSIGLVDPENFEIYATIDRYGDVDYYCFQADDSGWPGEVVVATLENIPAGEDYNLYLYKSRNDCVDSNELDISVNSGTTNEEVSYREPPFGDDSGIYVVGVRGAGNYNYNCDSSYKLTITGLR